MIFLNIVFTSLFANFDLNLFELNNTVFVLNAPCIGNSYRGKSSDVRLLSESIGISPLPGIPPAAYGSIIIPCVCYRHHREQLGFRCIDFFARFHMKGHGAPTSTAQHQADTSNVSDEMYIQLSRSTRRKLSDKKPFDKLLTYTDWERPNGNPKVEMFTFCLQKTFFGLDFGIKKTPTYKKVSVAILLFMYMIKNKEQSLKLLFSG